MDRLSQILSNHEIPPAQGTLERGNSYVNLLNGKSNSEGINATVKLHAMFTVIYLIQLQTRDIVNALPSTEGTYMDLHYSREIIWTVSRKISNPKFWCDIQYRPVTTSVQEILSFGRNHCWEKLMQHNK